jgi:hypothetical protein
MSKTAVDPKLQTAFADEARLAMGAPTLDEVKKLVGERVEITFNHDLQKRTGVLTTIIGESPREELVLDDDEDDPIFFRSIQTIKQVAQRELP